MDKTPPKSNSEIAKEVVGSCPVTCFSNISYREWRRDQGVLLGIIEKALDEKDKELESELARLRAALKLIEGDFCHCWETCPCDRKNQIAKRALNPVAESGEGN